MKTLRRNRCSTPRGARLLEQLESRLLLSANVAASVSNGVLYLTDSGCYDSVLIDQASLSATQFRVASGDGVTTINGTTAPLTFSGVNSIVINSRSANDTITIQNATVNANIQITGTTGNQVVTLNNVSVNGNFTLSNGGGQNSTDFEFSTIAGNLSINVGAGFDSRCGSYWGGSHFSNANEIFTLNFSSVGNNVSVTNASGQTTTDLEFATIGGNLNILNGGNSYGQTNFNYGSRHCGTGYSTAGDLFTMNFSTVNNNVSISNASDGNNTDIEGSTIGGALTVDNNVSSNGCHGFTLCGGSNIADASDAFTLYGTSVNGNVTIANFSDGATTDLDGTTILGNLNVYNGVGTHNQGFTTCANRTTIDDVTDAPDYADVFILTGGSTVFGNILLNNGSTFNFTDIEASSIGGSLTVNDALNLCPSSQSTSSQCGSQNLTFQCGTRQSYSTQCGSRSRCTPTVYTSDYFILSASVVGSSVSVANASGYTFTDIEASVIAADLTVIDQTGIAIFNMDSSIVGGNLLFVAGKGITNVDVTNSLISLNATITVVTQGATVVIDPSQVLGVLTIN